MYCVSNMIMQMVVFALDIPLNLLDILKLYITGQKFVVNIDIFLLFFLLKEFFEFWITYEIINEALNKYTIIHSDILIQ